MLELAMLLHLMTPDNKPSALLPAPSIPFSGLSFLNLRLAWGQISKQKSFGKYFV